jgi:hypothetical protein
MAAAILAVSALPEAPARATGGTPCNFEFDLVASPGLTTSPSSGTVTTNGETGTITCDGPVNGRPPTGPGTLGFEGRYGTKGGFSCHDDGQGEGVMSITIPSSDGAEHVTNKLAYAHGAYRSGQLFSGTIEGDRMSGTFQARPTDGDCVSKPMTKFHIWGKGTLT